MLLISFSTQNVFLAFLPGVIKVIDIQIQKHGVGLRAQVDGNAVGAFIFGVGAVQNIANGTAFLHIYKGYKVFEFKLLTYVI